MPFRIVEVLPDGRTVNHDQLGVFDTGAEAAAKIRELSLSEIKLQPRPFEAEDWKERERRRLAIAWYRHLPAEWQALPPIADHFAHISARDPPKIAYTENATKGIQDVQTQIKPGRYLATFHPDLAEGERNRLAVLIAKNDDYELRFARTPDTRGSFGGAS